METSLTGLGYREFDLAGDLLKAIGNGTQQVEQGSEDPMGYNLFLGFNSSSGNVYVWSEDGPCWMLNDDGKIEEWMNCGECGWEGWKSTEACENDVTWDGENGCCSACSNN